MRGSIWMPTKPSWLLQLPRIVETMEALDAPVVDRACFERVFGVKRRRAIQLMHSFGGYQAGRTFLIDRRELLRDLRRLAGGADYEHELARKTKLVSEIEKARRLFPGRQVTIMMPTAVTEQKLSDLPGGVHLKAGELRIEFYGTEDLLRQLFELAQAITNDYAKFQQICEMPDIQTSSTSDF